ncbi:DUF6525 family protein [Polynucleobacter sp.]|uniref:DUF6525 family protein n=1 Tax=Polynucleobacter sp. TaxID=2029855 RepID=UPI003F6A1F50
MRNDNTGHIEGVQHILTSRYAEMKAFDMLPQQVRYRLANANDQYSAIQALQIVQTGTFERPIVHMECLYILEGYYHG